MKIVTIILLLYINLGRGESAEKLNSINIEKSKAVFYFDNGNKDLAILKFKEINKASKKDAFYCWLNIALIEYDNKNFNEAKHALNNASKVVNSNKNNILLLSISRNIIFKNFVPTSPKLSFNNIDPLEDLAIWQLLYFRAIESDPGNNQTIEIKKIPDISLRRAIALHYQYISNSKTDRGGQTINYLIKSNQILEHLKLQNDLYSKNIKLLFYYTDNEVGSRYYDLFLRYEKISKIAQDLEIRNAICYYKARYYYSVNDLSLSGYYIREAYKYAPNDPNIILYLAYICEKQGNHKDAVEYYKRLMHYDKFKIEALTGAGKNSLRLGNSSLLNYYTNQIIKECAKDDMHLEAYSWAINYLLNTNQYALFAQTYPHVLKKIKNKDCKTPVVGIIHNNIGIYLWRVNKFEESLNEYQKALLALLPHEKNLDVYSDLDYSDCIAYPSLILYLNNKGEAFYQLSKTRKNKKEEIRDLKECFKNLNLSIEQLYKYKIQLSSEEQMYYYSELNNRKYPNIIKVCLELYNLTKDKQYHNLAFQFAEQGKATVMLSMLRGKNGSKIGLIPTKYKALEDSLNLHISLLNQELSSLKGEGSAILATNSKLENLVNQRTNLEKFYQQKYPSYYNLKYSLNVPSYERIQASLSDKECIIEFSLLNDFLLLYYIDKKSFIIKTDTLRNINLPQLGDRFYSQVNNFSPDNYRPDSVKLFVKNSRALYNRLLKPFEKNFKGKTIIIVSDNSLSKIPFEVLLTEEPAKISGYKNLPYLIKKNPIYYAPSVTFLDELRKRPTLKKRAKLLAVAPVYPSLKLNDTISRMLLAIRSDTSIFSSLPNARNEIMFANRIAGGELLAEKSASESEFKEIAGGYDIIHLATHGILNTDASLQSNLLFADSESGDDGFLHTYEIYNLNQASQLVILSACNTGAGKNYGGEGVISVGRGFLSSGSRSVIMTLWPVNDYSSYELIKGFYKELKHKHPIYEALRNSKLKFLEKADNLHSHPFFWTGYVIYGDASINLKIQNNTIYYIIGACLVLIALILWKYKAILKLLRLKNRYSSTGSVAGQAFD